MMTLSTPITHMGGVDAQYISPVAPKPLVPLTLVISEQPQAPTDASSDPTVVLPGSLLSPETSPDDPMHYYNRERKDSLHEYKASDESTSSRARGNSVVVRTATTVSRDENVDLVVDSGLAYQQWKLTNLLHLKKPLSVETCQTIGKLNKSLQGRKYAIIFNSITVAGIFDSFVEPTSKGLANWFGYYNDEWFEAFLSTCIKGIAKGMAGGFGWKQIRAQKKVSKELKTLTDNLHEDYLNIAYGILSHFSTETALSVKERKGNHAKWKRRLKTFKFYQLEDIRKEMLKLGVTEKQTARFIKPVQHAIDIILQPLDAEIAEDNIMKGKWQRMQTNMTRNHSKVTFAQRSSVSSAEGLVALSPLQESKTS